MPSKEGNRRVFVGLSGGVDSAVSAALLQEQGYDVTGVFIRTWHPAGFPCSEGEDEREAFQVAAHLGIPFKTLDLSERYERDVAKYLIDGYGRGETPNPDVLCNVHVKFGGFLDFARSHGVDRIATGHYARVVTNHDSTQLLRGVDIEKDQSYFLALVPKEVFSHVLFPIGHLIKQEVRALAVRFALPNAERKDSQGICFLGAVDMKAFLSAYLPLTSGAVLSEAHERIGTHDGAALYTLGQRHGFSTKRTTHHDSPLFVTSIDIEKNELIVSSDKHRAEVASVKLHSWNSFSDVQEPLCAQTRHRGACVPASLLQETSGPRVTFSQPTLVAPGQVVALYSQQALVGAGIVQR